MSTIDGFLTVREAALVIGVSHAQVTRYVKNRLLPHVPVGQQKLIPTKSVHEFKRPKRGNPAFSSHKP